MGHEIVNTVANMAAEKTQSIEVPRSQNRVVIFGSRVSGAEVTVIEFQDYLKERKVDNPDVQLHRDATRITSSFFGSEDPTQVSLPRGVIVFPEMRQYVQGAGMTIPTYDADSTGNSPFGLIRGLCEQFGVPFTTVGAPPALQQELEGNSLMFLPPPTQ